MDFSEALKLIKAGSCVRRPEMKGDYIANVSDLGIHRISPAGHAYSWISYSTDLLANDWKLVESDSEEGCAQ